VTATTATRSHTKPAAPHNDSPTSGSDRSVTVVSHVVLTIWAVIVILPLVWVFLSSFKTTNQIFASPMSLPTKLQWDNYSSAWTDSHLGLYLFNSVVVVSSALVVVMVLGAAAAYSLARYPFPGSRILYYLILAGLPFPIFLAVVPLFFVLKNFGLLHTLPGLPATYVAFAFPFTVFFLDP